MAEHFAKLDIFAINPITSLYFCHENKGKHKSVVGACCTVITFLIFIGYSTYFFIPIWNKTYPYYSQ